MSKQVALSESPVTELQSEMADEFQAIGELYAVTQLLTPSRIRLLTRFAMQVLERHDADVVRSFLEWKGDPLIERLLQATVKLNSQDKAKLLDAAKSMARNAN